MQTKTIIIGDHFQTTPTFVGAAIDKGNKTVYVAIDGDTGYGYWTDRIDHAKNFGTEQSATTAIQELWNTPKDKERYKKVCILRAITLYEKVARIGPTLEELYKKHEISKTAFGIALDNLNKLKDTNNDKAIQEALAVLNRISQETIQIDAEIRNY